MIQGNSEQKQRVNLSGLAMDVIKNDYESLNTQKQFSSFLNHIITHFYEDAKSSIDIELTKKQQQLDKWFSKFSGDYNVEAIKETLIEKYRQELSENKENYPQGESITFRLNKENFNLLYNERIEQNNFSAPSKYLKALFEEFARLSSHKREQIYCIESIENIIIPAIDANYNIKLSSSGKVYNIRPYALLPDSNNLHLYLVGYSKLYNDDSQNEKIASFRLTRIEKISFGNKRKSGRITKDEARQIESKIQQSGVQYLVGDNRTIAVKLSKNGVTAFKQRTYMRPAPDKCDRDDVYYFSCTPMQIKNYFIGFGKDAEILEPKDLRDEFLKFFKEAQDIYK